MTENEYYYKNMIGDIVKITEKKLNNNKKNFTWIGKLITEKISSDKHTIIISEICKGVMNFDVDVLENVRIANRFEIQKLFYKKMGYQDLKEVTSDKVRKIAEFDNMQKKLIVDTNAVTKRVRTPS